MFDESFIVTVKDKCHEATFDNYFSLKLAFEQGLSLTETNEFPSDLTGQAGVKVVSSCSVMCLTVSELRRMCSMSLQPLELSVLRERYTGAFPLMKMFYEQKSVAA